MQLLKKLLVKLVTMVIMVAVMGALLRYARPYIMKAAGMPETMPGTEGIETPHFSSEESDLMSTVVKGGLSLVTGTAKRDEVAGELTEKLYGGQEGIQNMSELGIELVKPGGGSPTLPGIDKAGAGAPVPAGGTSVANAQPGAGKTNTQPGASNPNSPLGAKLRAKEQARAGKSPNATHSIAVRGDLLAQVKERVKPFATELILVPVVLFGMFVVHRIRMRRSREDDLLPLAVLVSTPSDAEPINLTFPVHELQAEEFELLVALIYQRQGYRVSMPAGLSGGRGGDFTLLRKAERVLVQCKKVDLEHNVPVDRVRELHEAMATAGLTRGMYVASCRFSWDARNFAKAKGITLINARTLDALIGAARENPEEDLLEVSQWVSKLMSKVQLTPPTCPACEAEMDQVNASTGSMWVCTQRPDCRGRRIGRKYQKPDPAARKAEQQKVDAETIDAGSQAEVARQTETPKKVIAPKPSSATKQVDEIKHPDPVRQTELEKLAEKARLAIEAKRAARAKREGQIAQANQARPAAPATPVQQARPVSPAAPGNRATPASQAGKAVTATPGNRATPARQAAPVTPGNRATPANQARQVVPATPGNQARQAAPATPGNRTAPANQAGRVAPATPGNRATPLNQATKVIPATPGNRATPVSQARKVVPATPGNRSNS